MAGNASLNAAALAKEDEFYTQLVDIENELKHYRKHFKGKVVLCNCDDPFESNFFKFFVLNFNKLKLKRLIATSYKGSPVAGKQYTLEDLLMGAIPEEPEPVKKPYKAVVNAVRDTDGNGVTMDDVAELFRMGENELTVLEGDGDFRSLECLEFLGEADVVVTNPPFSLFREYMHELIVRNKSFIVVSPQNAVKYRDLFPQIMGNRIWLGYNNGDMAFMVPDYYEPKETRYWQDETGQKWRSMGNICWLTNLDIKKRHEEMVLVKRYKPEDYINFANYDAIIVNRVDDIPCDYAGVMGVPITFLDKHNPEQFEILGRTGNIEWATSEECNFFTPPSEQQQEIFKKQNKTWRVQNGYYVTDDGIARTVYDRIFIRNLHPEKPRG